MKDRVSANPGRVKLTPEDGSPAFYATMERADNPVEEGTPLNKSTLLSDAACDLLDIPQTSTVNEAFLKLALGVGKYGYTVHFQWPDGTPMVGYRVSGLTAIDGSALTTDDTGTVFGVSENTSVGVSVSTSFQDLNAASKTIRSTGILTEDTVKITSKSSFTLTADSSRSYQFSEWAPLVDICAVGGGGSGGIAFGVVYVTSNSIVTVAASGGAGGYVEVLENYNPAGKTLTCTIGAGADGVANSADAMHVVNGNSGGVTSVKDGSQTVVSAAGGAGGKAAYQEDYRSNNSYATASAEGSSGGSGSGGCRAYGRYTNSSTDPTFSAGVGASGENGASGKTGSANGSARGGRGQGTGATTFNGITYSAAGGGAAYVYVQNGSVEQTTEPGGSGGGAGKISETGGSGTTKGSGGGGALRDETQGLDDITSGAGADGRVIIKKAS